ncbi:MAG TPA: hypothetical protein DFL85_07110 [Lentisphaeria bacterium]|uniref:aminomethyltransferase family protein n=1 Tax=uncultured Victivallis sp. TaxID=354118 RepID=UPI000D041CA9|nr:glycine cleavage T C-terminal barrel domain-containing protein [uncultured Victivallis sp.]AVM44743.1 hypothetical protein C5Q97_08470 [Victivallales bacterium CCUG 44730]HBP07887.1 hypothetical protein [Lentisphaeria bacterium]HCH85265.1 hypothetical protein [Lentisphaeria bacterium]
MGALKTTPLTGYEIELGAKMTPRAGWNTALYYPEGIIAEHRHTRSACSVFDLCSYGKLRVAGKEAAPALDTLFARPAADLGIGRCRRNFMLSETGGVLSLVLMLRMAEDDFLLVTDTGSAAGDLERISAHIAGRDAEVQELTPLLACLGLEGPEARKVLESFAAGPLPEYSCCGTVEIDGFRAIAACAGATGEEGFRLLFNLEYADQLWDLLLETEPVMPAGFGALDSLRLEMGYPACGRELTAEFSPLDSGLGDLVRLDDARSFPGRQALLNRKQRHVLAGLLLETRRAAREGTLVLNAAEEVVGVVTGGSFCPSLETAAALCRLDLACMQPPGSELWCEVTDARLPGRIAEPPFYRGGSAKGDFFLP